MKNIIKNLLWWLSFGLWILIVVYAATISSLWGNTINKGDTIEESWFQKVDDKLWELANNISWDNLINLDNPVNNTDAATKSYVDASAWAAPWSIDRRDCETKTDYVLSSQTKNLVCSSGYTIVDSFCSSDSANGRNYWHCSHTSHNTLYIHSDRSANSSDSDARKTWWSIKCCKVNQ